MWIEVQNTITSVLKIVIEGRMTGGVASFCFYLSSPPSWPVMAAVEVASLSFIAGRHCTQYLLITLMHDVIASWALVFCYYPIIISETGTFTLGQVLWGCPDLVHFTLVLLSLPGLMRVPCAKHSSVDSRWNRSIHL